MSLVALLVGGLLASGQITAQEAVQRSLAMDMTSISQGLARPAVDWIAAGDASKISIDQQTMEVASCATSRAASSGDSLQARAFIQAVGRLARKIDLATNGSEQIRVGELHSMIEERSIAILPAMSIKEQIDFKQGEFAVACVLVSGISP